MELIRGLYNLKSKHRSCVATIGNFDGVHLGHQQLIARLKQQARQFNLPAVVITFEPQPNEFFGGEKVPARLTRLREKLAALQDCGVDKVLCCPFNQTFADLSPEEFIDRILIQGLGVRCLIIGDDFRFGHARKGDFALLQKAADKNNFILEKMPTMAIMEERVSSTRVRKALEIGDLKTAEKLLGRPFTLSGRVAHGDKRGRIIGFPTANIYLHRKKVPIMGVYVVKMHGLANKAIPGVANVGNRPTVGGSRSLLEVHLFDFNQDIYGKHVTVEFIHKLRDEKRYDSFELLKQQIFRDAEQAREYFRSRMPS